MDQTTPSVFIVDDDRDVRDGIARLLRAAGLSHRAFASAAEFLDAWEPGFAGCILLDLAMPGFDGLALQRELKSRGIALPVVFLTGQADVPQTVQAMKAGASDFLMKPPAKEQLLAAVRAAMVKDAKRCEQGAVDAEDRSKLQSLTPRERQVFDRVVRGQLNKQIAAELGTVERTVKFHRAAVMRKLGFESLAELVSFAERLRRD